MADFNPNNNNSNGSRYDNNRVSTVGITLFDDQSTILKMGYAGDTLTLSIMFPVPGENRNTYPDTHRHPITLTVDRAAAMYNEILPKIADAVTQGNDYAAGVFLNKDKNSILQLRAEKGEVYLVLCNGIHDDRTASNTYVFHFQKTEIIEGYDPSGSYTDKPKVEGSFFLFSRWLGCGIDAVVGAGGHAIRKTNQYTTNSIFEYLKGIAAKLGVTPQNNGGFRRGGSYAQNTNTNTNDGGFLNVPAGTPDELPFADFAPSETSMADLLS